MNTMSWIRRCSFVLVILSATGCGGRLCHREPPRGRVKLWPEINLAGYVVRDDATGQEELIDLTGPAQPFGKPIAPNEALEYTHEAKLRIRDRDERGTHTYRVLLGPDPNEGGPARGMVKTSVATMCVGQGWILLIGQLPIAQTELVETSATGTLMAVRVERTVGRHTVYNLEPLDSECCVLVRVAGDARPICLAPQERVWITSGATAELVREPIPAGDPFVAHMVARASAAKFEIGHEACADDKQRFGHVPSRAD